eukprot:COSAG01_NODE_67816_length_266_cov_0.532934_1_plen_56_part_10
MTPAKRGALMTTAAQLLLERGADPNLADSAGLTPLMRAAVAGNLAGVRLLLARRVA